MQGYDHYYSKIYYSNINISFGNNILILNIRKQMKRIINIYKIILNNRITDARQ